MIARLAAEHALREAHHGTFAPLLWFLVLPGPLGLVLYPLALRAARSLGAPWSSPTSATSAGSPRAPSTRSTGSRSARRAFAFAVVGNFEDALYCWRSQAAQWLQPEEGIVLASAGAACAWASLFRIGPELTPRPPLGSRRDRATTLARALEGCCGAH